MNKSKSKNMKKGNKNVPIIVSLVIAFASLLFNFITPIVSIVTAVIGVFYILFYFDKKVGFYFVALCTIVISVIFAILTLCGVFEKENKYEVRDVYEIKEMNFETKVKALIYAGVFQIPDVNQTIKVDEEVFNKLSNEDLLTDDCEGYAVIKDISGNSLTVDGYIKCGDKYMTTGYDLEIEE